MAKKQVEGRASKQAPANRTTYFEILKFHITGNDEKYDFSDLVKAMKVYNSGREITAYIERHGYLLRKGISIRTACDEGRNCGLTPKVSRRYIGTWSTKYPITQGEVDKLVTLSVETNLKGWKEACSF